MIEKQITLGLAGSTGYSGQVIYALAMHHPGIAEIVLSERHERRGFAEPSDQAVNSMLSCDVVVLALPHEISKIWVERLIEAGCSKIIDLSDSYRCEKGSHYGIPELFGGPSESCSIVANPGCYPTAVLLALRPLVDAGLIEKKHIAILGTSGATGAGKTLSEQLHFCHLSENTFPYQVGQHRHIPEIEKHLGHGVEVSFVTQLLPIQRGMVVTGFVRPCVEASIIHDALVQYYSKHSYVTVLPKADRNLGVRNVVGSHQALIATGTTIQSGMMQIFASIDNLMRGAASQAIHNLNLWMKWPEYLGLPVPQRANNASPLCWAQQISALGEQIS